MRLTQKFADPPIVHNCCEIFCLIFGGFPYLFMYLCFLALVRKCIIFLFPDTTYENLKTQWIVSGRCKLRCWHIHSRLTRHPLDQTKSCLMSGQTIFEQFLWCYSLQPIATHQQAIIISSPGCTRDVRISLFHMRAKKGFKLRSELSYDFLFYFFSFSVLISVFVFIFYAV